MAGKTIAQLEALTAVGRSDLIVLQKQTFPSGTRKATARDFLKGQGIRKTPIRYNDPNVGWASYIEYLTSATVLRSTFLAQLQADKPGAVLEQIGVDVMVIGGGAGGAYGGTTGYGGYPGQVITKSFMLSQFDTEIGITVGNGGNPGSPGGYSEVASGDIWVKTNAADRGGNSDAEENSFFARLQPLLGFVAGRRTDVAATTIAYAPNNGNGPGFGGALHTSRPVMGGAANVLRGGSWSNGPSTPGQSGWDSIGPNNDWEGFGVGGAGNKAGVGGNGGRPGGGGGAGTTGGPATNGKGGAGAVRFRFWTMEGA